MRSRQKSCVPCAEAKRRCDPQTPKCPRCETRGLECYYKNQPLRDVTQGGRVTKQRCSFRFDERSAPLTATQAHPTLPPPPPGYSTDSSNESTASHQDRHHGHHQQQQQKQQESSWTTITGPVVGATTLVPPDLTEEELDKIQTLYFPSVGDGTDQALNWSYYVDPFLTNPLPPIAASIDRWAINLFFRKVSTWPREFVQKLQTPFINKYLNDGTTSSPSYSYLTSSSSSSHSSVTSPFELLPFNLQDAFSACAGYLARTPDNHQVALSIIDRTVSRILDRDPFSISLSEHVSSLQAVVLLHVIQLWDGDVRQRGKAESRADLIEKWAMLLSSRVASTSTLPPAPPRSSSTNNGNSSSNNDRFSSSPPPYHPNSVPTSSSVSYPSSSDMPAAAAMIGPHGPHNLWHDWLLQESARRVALITMGVQAIYEASKFGVCTYIPVLSKLSLTVSDKPWDAGDFDQWFRWHEEEKRQKRLNNDEEAAGGRGIVEYEDLSKPYKEAGPQGTLPPPSSPFARLLLVPCLGAAYRHVIGEKF